MTLTEAGRRGAGPEGFGALVAGLRGQVTKGATRPLGWRQRQLAGLRALLREREGELLDALAADLGKPAIEAWTTELGHVARELGHISANLGRWSAPERVRVRAVLRPARARVVPEPLGVVLVLAPWNYPVHLLLLPAAYALAAGNTVVAKPSELAPATSAALATWVPRYVDPEALALVEGGPPVATALLEERFDHVFYTGNGRVGRLVMAAAARHLTPVTLELGGRSPVIVERSADLDLAARRIARGKLLNAGQTCVAPNHALVDRSVEGPFLAALARAIERLYGPDPRRSPDYARIVTREHWDRLDGLLEDLGGARLALGGERVRDERYVAPTVVAGVGGDEPVMAEEIFGPILPVMAVDGVEEALAQVNEGDKPLALYVFSGDRSVVERVVAATSSGGVCANDTMVHLAVPGLPFGGVGASGMGAYHGRAGFETFSHRKGVLERSGRLDPPLGYPPYTRMTRWVLRKAL